MPASSSRGEGGGGGRKRYAAAVEKGDNAWRREWSSFISGVDMKRVRDGSTTVSLKAKSDLAPRESADDAVSRGGGEPSFSAAPASFSYLFSSPAERRAERAQKLKREADAKKQKQRERTASKHQQATAEAVGRGLKLEGMTRKEVRAFLHLSRSKEQAEAQQRARELKLYELMDDKLAWYQQGPHPIDLIAERLVARKAAKKGKRLGLHRYNYLLPHPSWMCARARRRREGVLVGLGKRFTFDEETGQAMDPLRNTPVDLTRVPLLLNGGDDVARAAAAATAGLDAVPLSGVATAWDDGGSDGEMEGEERACEGDAVDARATGAGDWQKKGRIHTSAGAGPAPFHAMADRQLLVDPTRALTTFARAIVRNREAALAIQRANLTTDFLSSRLVKGPSSGNEDGECGGGGAGERAGAVVRRLSSGKGSAEYEEASAPRQRPRVEGGEGKGRKVVRSVVEGPARAERDRAGTSPAHKTRPRARKL